MNNQWDTRISFSCGNLLIEQGDGRYSVALDRKEVLELEEYIKELRADGDLDI